MSRAVVATAYGSPDVLDVIDVEVGDPGPGRVRLDVRASAVNAIDWKLYSGRMGDDPAKLPMRLGFEVAGVVTAVGEGAEGPAGPVSVGDEVIAYPVSGGYAEVLLAKAANVVPKPASLAWPEAAGLLLTGVTAVHALTATAVDSGDTVLVHGGAGGVGLMLVQLARVRGASVIATASGSNHDLLRSLGAEPVVYGDGLADRVRTLAPGGVDVAVDAVGTDEAVDASLALVPDRQRIATVAAFARAPQAGIKLLGNGPGADPGMEIRSAARPELARLAGEGRIRVVVGRTLPLAQAAEAHRAGIAGHGQGKTVLVP